jgi:hypothetical protein
MSALSIIVGWWLLLNAVVFAALMLRRDRPVLRDRLFRWMVGDEVHDRLGDLAIGAPGGGGPPPYARVKIGISNEVLQAQQGPVSL